MGMAKVWPLVKGLKGFDATGIPCDLEPGIPRWMEYETAMAAQAKGHVQLMAGLDSGSLLQPPDDVQSVTADVKPETQAAPKRRGRPSKKTYSRKDMVAEKPE